MEKIKKYASDFNIPIMQDSAINYLINFIKEKKIFKILELGSAIGYSAIKMASIDKKIKITTIERDDKRFNEALKNINKFNLNEQITIINDDIFNVTLDDKFDLIFIDAAKAQNIKFFEKFKNNLNDKGYIITDNLSFHDLVKDIENIKSKNLRALVRKINNYIEYLKDNKEFKTIFLNIGDGMSISNRG